ncbi:MAG TPA: 4-(cytidine 5'-diphospho)-2-C-methyl-D-erythritol kinase, partial [Bacillota bacterium]|nr:4-(cytidine 5'-diphospho)-2-C-methyl-D-erythritol kinase [Bacillota bacterium]
KINLALDVLYRRPDGYHEVDMVMQPLTLADEIFLEPAPQIELTCQNSQVPQNQQNLAWKAAELLRRKYEINQGVKITLQKNIPVAAGLAGGSTDAAAVLTGLNQLWDLRLSMAELMELGVKLGADVPFCVLQQTARAQGIGEILTPLKTSLDCQVLLITPNIGVSTPLVYQQLVVAEIQKHPRINQVIAALEQGDLARLVTEWGNVLEEVVLPRYPQVKQLKELLKRHGAVHCLMSGSGPSVFALNPSETSIEGILRELPPEWFRCVCRFK